MMLKQKLQLAQKFLGKADSRLRKIIHMYGTCTLKPHRNYFHTLVGSIISQQISVKAAESIERRLLEQNGGTFEPNNLMRLKTSQFHKAGVSPQKIRYLKDLSRKWLNGSIKHATFSNLSDEEIITELVKVKGIGRWTAEMFLIFSLGRLDVLPVDDLGFKKAIRKVYGSSAVPSERTIRRLGEKWRPYRSVATWYLWKSLDNKPM